MGYYRMRKKLINGENLIVAIVLLMAGCYIVVSSKLYLIWKPKRVVNTTKFDGAYKTSNIKIKSSKDVLLFGYMRGGTSLLADFYRNSPGTFFVFEPLMPFASYHYFTDTSLCNMRDTRCINVNRTRLNEALTTLTNIYTCNIRKLSGTAIDKIFEQKKSSPPWLNLEKCFKASRGSPVAITKCFYQIEKDCRNADIRVVKAVRLSFTHVDFLLSRLANLHVIYLMRDPRAIIHSRITTDWFPVMENDTASAISNIDSLCQKMNGDLSAYQQLHVKYNDRIKQMWVDKLTETKETMMYLLYNYRKNYQIQRQDDEFLQYTFTRKIDNVLFKDWRTSLRRDYTERVENKCTMVLPRG